MPRTFNLTTGQGGWARRVACLIVATLVAAAPIPTSVQAPETAGMVGEVKPGRGRVEVKPAGAADWRPARPLGALRSGDHHRASEDAAAVVVLSGGRGSVKSSRP